MKWNNVTYIAWFVTLAAMALLPIAMAAQLFAEGMWLYALIVLASGVLPLLMMFLVFGL